MIIKHGKQHKHNNITMALPYRLGIRGRCALYCMCVVFCVLITESKSQETGLITDIQDNTPSELNNIIFTGNTFFTSSQLSEILSLRTSNFSPGLIFFSRLRKESLKNPYAPKAFTDHLQGVVKSYQESEIRYYNPAIAADDSATILELYNQFGFHRATIQYSFFRDSLSESNTLRFDINEGIRNTIDTVVYKGLERITQQLKEKIEKIRTVKRNSPFDEAQIKSDIDKVVNLLSNEGYFTVGYDSVLPTVTEKSANNTDSITVYFVIGNQLKINSIIIQHDYREQNPVAKELILKMLDIQPGDYYSRATIQNSLNNLLQLGLFERPSIDTVGLGKLGNDSTIPLRVFLPYRQARELSVSPLANRLAVDNFFNLGIEASFLHRNLGGAAQSLNLFVRYMLQDFQIQIPGQFFNWLNSEIQAGINFSQPLLFSIDRARMGASAQLLYSDRDVRIVITDEFTSPSMRLRSTSLRLAFPVQLPKHTFFNAAYFDIFTDASAIAGFENANTVLQEQLGEALSNADTEERSNQVSSYFSRFVNELIPFAAINGIENRTIPLSSFIIGFGISGDDRDNIFSPTKGYLATISAEIALRNILGVNVASTFNRLQFLWTTYSTVGKKQIFATKFRAGHTFVANPADDYVPFERHFFAGGSNSVRAYPARALYDPLTASTGDGSSITTSTVIGNRTIIEGSFEYRWGLSKPSWANEFIGDQIEKSGFGFFLDWGNAFNRFYASNDTVSFSLKNMIKSMAVGIGAGYRYETPVGPFRVDFAIPFYDPLSLDREFITRRSPFNQLQIHIALGHAF